MMGFIADSSILKVIGTLLLNKEDATVKGFHIASYLLGLEQLENLDHHLSPPFQAQS